MENLLFSVRVDVHACVTYGKWRGVRVVEDDGCVCALTDSRGFCRSRDSSLRWTRPFDRCADWDILGFEAEPWGSL